MEADEPMWIFAGRTGTKLFLDTSIEHQHKMFRRQLQLSEEAVIHSFRYTFLTRLGESGVGVFSIMKIAGHSSVKASERYVQPSPESVERAIAGLQEFNGTAIGQLPAAVVDSGNKALAADEH